MSENVYLSRWRNAMKKQQDINPDCYHSGAIVYQVLSKKGAVRRPDPLSGTIHAGLCHLVCRSLVPHACSLQFSLIRISSPSIRMENGMITASISPKGLIPGGS